MDVFNQTFHWMAIAGKHPHGGMDAPTLIRTQDWDNYYFGDSTYLGIGLREKLDSGLWFIQNDFGLMDDAEAKDNYRNMIYKTLRSAALFEHDADTLMSEHESNPFESPADLAGVIKPNGKLILPEARSTIGVMSILIAKELPFSEWKKRTAMKEDLFKWLYSQSYFNIMSSGDVIYHQAGGNVITPHGEYIPPVFNELQYATVFAVYEIFDKMGWAKEAENLRAQADYLIGKFGK